MYRLLTACAIAPLFLVRLATAEEYRDHASHFSFEIPPGWEAMPPETLESINAMVGQRIAQVNIRYEQGFVPRDEAFDGYPYVLVQVARAKMKGVSFDQIERQLEKELQTSIEKAEEVLADLGSDLSAGSARLDRDNKQIIVPTEMNVAGAGRVQGLSIGFLSSEGTAFLHCYDLKSRFQQRLPIFQAMARSFKIDPGYEFTPKWGGIFSTGNPIVDGALNMGLIGAIVGGVVGGVVYGVRRLQKSRSAPPVE